MQKLPAIRITRMVRAAILSLIVLGVVPGVAYSEPDTTNTVPADLDYMATLAFVAKSSGDWLPDFYRLNPGLSEAQLYEVQRRFVARQLADNAAISGFKGGFVPKAPVGGVLLDGGALKPGTTMSLGQFKLLIVEAEIGFRFCQAVDKPLADIAALKAVVCELMPVMEIADGALRDFGKLKADFTHLRNTLIPLNVASAFYLPGSPVPAASVNLDEVAVSASHNKTSIGARSMTPRVDLWASVLWVVNEFVLANGYQITPGQFIIPGNLTGIHAAQVGHYVMEYEGLGRVELDVTP